MTDGHHVILLVEVAVGVIVGFVVWSYVAPMVFSGASTATPAA